MDRRTARSYNDEGLQAGVSIPAPIFPCAASVRLLFTMLHPRCDAMCKNTQWQAYAYTKVMTLEQVVHKISIQISICNLRISTYRSHCSLVHRSHSSIANSSLIYKNTPIARYNEYHAKKKCQSVSVLQVVNIRLIDTSQICSSL